MQLFKRKSSPAIISRITRLTIEGLDIELTRKDIKRLYLRVSADGRVRVSAPKSAPVDAVRGFVVAKQEWIKRQQMRFRARGDAAPPEYVDGEAHYFNGGRYLLSICEHNGPGSIRIRDQAIELSIRPGTSPAKRQALIENWYRRHLKESIPKIIARYEGPMGVRVHEFGVKRMRTRWGTCNIRARRIWLSLELAKRPYGCLEYVVVHEMTHLLEVRHNRRFYALMDEFLPDWREYREALRRFPSDHDPLL